MIIMDEKSLRDGGRLLASAIGFALQQSYAQVDGVWWLFTRGQPMRALTDDEVQWHVERNHAPFCDGGVTPESPDWWKDPH